MILLFERALPAFQAEIATHFGGTARVSDEAVLDAIMSHAATVAARPGSDVASVAAAYGYGLAHDLPFEDANLPTAAIALETFLRLNGHELGADDTTCFLGLMVVANGELGEDAFAAWIRRHLRPYRA